MQDTGPSTVLPNGEGMFRFGTAEQAVQAFEAINADYERHCRAARKLAEAHFDAKQITAKILSHALKEGAFPRRGIESPTAGHGPLATDYRP